MFPFKYKICHFCELPIGDYEDSESLRDNSFRYKNIWVCDGGISLHLSKHYLRMCGVIREKINTIMENELCVLCNDTTLGMELPHCNHRLCLNCIKTIYFGSSTQKRPQHWGELSWPQWPKEVDEKHLDNYLWYSIRDRFIKYNKDITLEELKQKRDLSKTYRPSWMNQPKFLEYEDSQFDYYLNTRTIMQKYTEYENTKVKGNKKCPYCRA